MMKLILLGVLVLVCSVVSLPTFSWEYPPAYQHCANSTGLFNQTQLEVFMTKSFVVLEKSQCELCDPSESSAEKKIIEAAMQIKNFAKKNNQPNGGPQVIFYFAIDWTRTSYDIGQWFTDHPELLLECGGTYISNPVLGHIFALNIEEARTAYINFLVETARDYDEYIDGFFIDGFQTFMDPSVNANCTSTQLNDWINGAHLTMQLLRQALPANKTLIFNPEADMDAADGFMMETFFPGNADILHLQNATNKLVEVHSDVNYGSNWAWEVSFAAFLIGAQENHFFGDGHHWEDCSSWSFIHNEYSKKLGAPLGNAIQNGNLWTRLFQSGTTVWLNTTQKIECCIQWSDGTFTGEGGECANLPESNRA